VARGLILAYAPSITAGQELEAKAFSPCPEGLLLYCISLINITQFTEKNKALIGIFWGRDSRDLQYYHEYSG
jgi:hypothetical protein